MTELETMQRAKMYIHKLANGIDPLTDQEVPQDAVLNQVRLSRCFFYVETLIDRAIERETRGGRPRRKDLPPFSLTPEQKRQVVLSDDPLPISKFAAALNAAVEPDTMKKLRATTLTAWLLQKGFLQEIIRNDKRIKEPTASGTALGITAEWREAYSTGAHYMSILYSRAAQQFLLDNLDSILAEEADAQD